MAIKRRTKAIIKTGELFLTGSGGTWGIGGEEGAGGWSVVFISFTTGAAGCGGGVATRSGWGFGFTGGTELGTPAWVALFSPCDAGMFESIL